MRHLICAARRVSANLQTFALVGIVINFLLRCPRGENRGGGLLLWSARVNSHWHTRVTSKILARVHPIHNSWGGRGLSGEFVHKRGPLTRLLLVLNASFSSSATWRQSPKGRRDSAGLLLLQAWRWCCLLPSGGESTPEIITHHSFT